MKQEPYWVTVGVPVYNSEKFIKRCISSILNQTYQNIEVIIVDDGSTDNSLKVINELKENYKGCKKVKIFTKCNEGLSKTRNYIINKSTCDFIYFMDSDDWIENDTIEKLVNIQCKYNCDIVKINYFINYNEAKSIRAKQWNENKVIKVKDDRKNIIEDIMFGNIVSYSWTMMIRKEKILPNLLFEDCHQEDKIFLIKILSNIEAMHFSSENLYHYYINPNGIMHKHDFEYYLNQDFTLHEMINNIIEKFYNNDSELHRVNNSMTSYFIERNLYNVYKTKGKDKLFEVYNKIKNDWNKIRNNVDYNLLKKSNYAIKKDYYIKLWEKEDFTNIIKHYDKENKFENLEMKIKQLIKKY